MNEWNFFTFSLHFQFLSFTRIFHRFCLGSSSGSSFCLAIPLYHLHKVYLFTTSSSSLLFSSVSVNSFFMGLFHLLLLFYLIQPLLTISGQVSIVNNARHHRCLCVWELFVFKSSAMNPHRVRGKKRRFADVRKFAYFTRLIEIRTRRRSLTSSATINSDGDGSTFFAQSVIVFANSHHLARNGR